MDRKCLVEEKNQWRVAMLVQADWKTALTHMTILYICGEQRSAPECTTPQTMRLMGYNGKNVTWLDDS